MAELKKKKKSQLCKRTLLRFDNETLLWKETFDFPGNICKSFGSLCKKRKNVEFYYHVVRMLNLVTDYFMLLSTFSASHNEFRKKKKKLWKGSFFSIPKYSICSSCFTGLQMFGKRLCGTTLTRLPVQYAMTPLWLHSNKAHLKPWTKNVGPCSWLALEWGSCIRIHFFHYF